MSARLSCALFVCLLSAAWGEPCFDQGIKCPQFRSFCKNDFDSSKITDTCRATCDRCKLGKEGPATDAEALSQIQACCIGNKMNENCLNLCRYDTTQDEVFQAASDGVCSYYDAKVWVMCASAGNDNTECCRKEKVDKKCQIFCQGGFNTSTAFGCFVDHLEPIEKCHRQAFTVLETPDTK